METAERVFSRGWAEMKLYFMIGLPTEEDEDVRGIVETGARARDVGRKRAARPRARGHGQRQHARAQAAHAVPVVRDGPARRACCASRRMLRDEARADARRSCACTTREGSWLEGVLARGDRTLVRRASSAPTATARASTAGTSSSSSTSGSRPSTHYGIDAARLPRHHPGHARLPWDHIDVGLEDGFLAREYRKALKNRLSPPCGKVVGHLRPPHEPRRRTTPTRKKLVCYDCGVACDLTEMRERAARLPDQAGRGHAQEAEAHPARRDRGAGRGRDRRRAG